MVALNSELLRHRLRHRLGIAGDHHNLYAHLLQPADRLARTLAHPVGQSKDGKDTRLVHQRDDALPPRGGLVESFLRRLAYTESHLPGPLGTTGPV